MNFNDRQHKWRSAFGQNPGNDTNSAYHDRFRRAALERFRWSERDLNLREAVCLFRICTYPVRRPQPGWHNKLEAGLTLVNETLE